jgi:mannose-1-phosphate guanylyltransferase
MAQRKTPRHVAILAGGSGTRFWPAGTASRPKQLLALDGEDPRSLLRATYDRVAPLCDGDGPWVVAAKALAPAIRKVLPAKAKRRLILEPVPRNTAAAIALAAHVVDDTIPEKSPERDATVNGPLLAFVPADARVGPEAKYRAAIATMFDRVEAMDGIVLLGVRPTFPATGYGYVELGALRRRTRGGAAHAVHRFVEKPSLAVAKRYVRGRRHVWNLGTFAAGTASFLSETFIHFPPTDHAIEPSFHPPHDIASSRLSARTLARLYPSIPSVSFDHAVMEKVDPQFLEVVVTDLDWDDLGSWDAVARHAKTDAAGNAIPAGSEAVDAKNCCVRVDDGTVVALLGVEDLVVVRTAKATLVAKRGRGEDVRKVVERLKAAGRGDVVS